MSLLQKFRSALHKTSSALTGGLQHILTPTLGAALDASTLQRLEKLLLSTDLGPAVTADILAEVKRSAEGRIRRGEQSAKGDVVTIARQIIEQTLSKTSPQLHHSTTPSLQVILLVGVNGTGKTTAAARLAHRYQLENKAVLLAACDTFRAAAIEQLQIWGQRLHCDVIASQTGADSASVAHDALSAALSRKADVLILDTAGRQHTKAGLMTELQKIRRVLAKQLPTAPHDTFLVLDATTGLNALAQAREFHKAVPLTGLIVCKLDGTARGGIVVAIARDIGLPVRFVGLGEQLEDLQPFDSKEFSAALFES